MNVLGFSEFINEELNVNRDNDVIKLESQWFYYNYEDDIIYGCDEKPVGDEKLFSFNPSSCTLIIDGQEKQYDVNNPVCLIKYDFYNDVDVTVYTEDALKYLKSIGFRGNDITSQSNKNHIMDIFERGGDTCKYILIYGNDLIASTFDIIEEE